MSENKDHGAKKKLFASLAQPLPVHYPSLSSAMRKQVREAYVYKQKGLCAHCNTKLIEEPDILIQRAWIDEKLFPEGFFDHPIHLHHDHNTGKTIGAIHARCNAYLWQYKGE